ncbi:hypothetical protein V6N12_004737 [Hibiscus sabdariffa]|uniref:Uncharacterized protein n=1 Tax=Hibiscus sabdariffa TaxID=183260 RepID=A0ABR2CMD5_9ROSI
MALKMHVEVAQHASKDEAANVFITNVADKVACIVEESDKVVVSAIVNEVTHRREWCPCEAGMRRSCFWCNRKWVPELWPASFPRMLCIEPGCKQNPRKEKSKHSSPQLRQPLGAVVMMDGEETLMK